MDCIRFNPVRDIFHNSSFIELFILDVNPLKKKLTFMKAIRFAFGVFYGQCYFPYSSNETLSEFGGKKSNSYKTTEL